MFVSLPRLFNKFLPLIAKTEKRRREARYACPRLEELEGRIVPDAYTWTGNAGDTNWMNALNWFDNNNPGNIAVPGSHDTAFIPNGYIVDLNADATVAGLTDSGVLNLNAKLSVTTFTSPGTFNVNSSGELDNVGSGDFGGDGTISGQVDAGGSGIAFDLGSDMTLNTGAKLTGLGMFTINGAVHNNAALSQDSPITMNNDGGATSFGSLTGSGSLSLGGDFTWNGGVLGLSGGITLQPNSGLQTAGSDPKELTSGTLTSLALLTDLGGTGTLTIDHSGTFDNEAGEVDVTLPTISIPGASYGPGLFINNANGILKLETAGTLTIDGTFSNQGKLEVADGTTVSLSNLEFDTVNLDGTLQLGGDLDLAGGSTISAPTGLVVNAGAGVLKVGPATTLNLTMGANFFGNVEVEYNGGLSSGGKVTNSGKLTLDVGARTNLSAYQQTSDGTLEEHASGATSSSSLSVSGDAELSGTLDMVFDGGYTPTSGTLFTVLTAGSIGAHFDTTPANMTVTYDPTDVTLTQN